MRRTPLLLLFFASACASALRPPKAHTEAHTVSTPAGSRTDEYYWMRDDTRTRQDVLAHLASENTYTDGVMKHTQSAQELLYKELVGHVKQDDASAPVLDRGYAYYQRRITGGEYTIYCRKQSPSGPEQVLLDGNQLASGHDFFAIGGYEVSDDNKLLSYSVDVVGRRQWTIKLKNLVTGEVLADEIPNAEEQTAFTADGRAVLYVEKDPVTLLSTRVKKHVLGTDARLDAVVYEEKDHSFYLGVSVSRSHKYLLISLQSTVATEIWTARADDPALRFSVVLPRERHHEYSVEDLGDRYVMRTNYQAKNFRIVEAPMAKVGDRSAWRDVVPHRDDAFIESFLTFRDFLAVAERSAGLSKVRVKRWSRSDSTLIAADEPSYASELAANPDVGASQLRYVYTSLTTPSSVYEYDVTTAEKRLLKQESVLGGFDSKSYSTEYLHVALDGGVSVPVSIVYRKGLAKNGTAPLLQDGYGAYGYASDPHFDADLLSLLDRGFVYAIAHVRGGQELGRRWYEDGKLMNKKHTFSDFVAVTDFLVENKYVAKERVFARGRSAGGLLIGAVANLAPEKYRGMIVGVPFVDVVTTMLDESIPLTTNEFDEWGNPKEKAAYEYMLSYSPYDNVAKKAYPAMLVTTGLWDSQVQYYEPAKWVARLRARKTDSHPLLLKVNMEAGHGGKSGRFQRYRELALEYAFLFDVMGRNLVP